MKCCCCLFPRSSIGKKVVMALTGLLLAGFLVSHLAGNFLLFVGPAAYNNYSHALISNPLIYVAEALLVLIFVYHVVAAIMVSRQNSQARPIAYAVSKPLGKRTPASSTMLWSGLIVFYFLVIHLATFKFGKDVAPPSPEGVRDLYSLVVAKFQVKTYSIFYVLCMIIMGFHLSHALQSSLRTLGLSHPQYLKVINVLSIFTGIFFAVGYSVFPIYFGFVR